MNPGMENIHVAADAGDLKGNSLKLRYRGQYFLADILIHLTEDAYCLVKDEGYLIMSGLSLKMGYGAWLRKLAGFFLETHMVQGEECLCL